jgi:hypothetical protein
LIDDDKGEIISERYPMGVSGFYVLKWTPSLYKAEGYNLTVGCDAFVSSSNPLGAWSEMPNGFTKHVNVVKGVGGDMAITLPNPNGELFLNDTVFACDDYTRACTEFRFGIGNNGTTTQDAWYKVNIVDGATIYPLDPNTLIHDLAPGATSIIIDDLLCAIQPGGLPVGEHTVKVEVGPAGEAATDTVTNVIYVLEEAALTVTTYQPFLTIWKEGAKVKGSVANTNGLITDVGFEYGETTSYGDTTWAGETDIPINFFKDIIGLEPSTLYHFRAIATNDSESAHGVDKSFTTIGLETGTVFEILLPNTTLLEQDEVMACDDWEQACTLFNFQIENKWYAGLTAWYTISIEGGGELYSEDIVIPGYSTSNMISNTVCALPGGLPVGEHTILVEVGQVSQAKDTHLSETLTVLEYGTPTVETKGVENPTFTSATLMGTLKDVGLLTSVGFEYGLRYGSTKVEWLPDPIKGGTFKSNLSNLEGNETYRFRAVGRMGDKTGFGVEQLFETVPAVITPISMGWNLEDAKIDEYNVHLSVSNLSETKRYRILLYGGRGYEFARIDPVTGLKEVEIKANIPIERFKEYGYEVHCGVYDLDTSEWLLTEGYPVSPLSISVNMGATIAAGGIPDEMETRTDTTFTFIVDNNSTTDLNVDVFLSFKGVDTPLEYSHDLVGLQPSEGVYILPGTDITVLNDGYIAKEMLILKAGESGSYALNVWLPNEAVPSGQDSASYTIHTRVGIHGI